MNYTYMDCLAIFGIGGAHPGGLYVTEQALKGENLTPASAVLDVGCGTGQTAVFVEETFRCKVTAIDIHPIMVAKAKERCENLALSVVVRKGDVENLPFSDGNYDYVLSESVLSFTDISASLAEIRRVLKGEGVLIAIEAVIERKDKDLGRLKDFYGFTKLFSEDEWVRLFNEAGFKKVEIVECAAGLGPAATIESAPDFSPSPEIDEELYDILEHHQRFLQDYQDVLSFRVFRCS